MGHWVMGHVCYGSLGHGSRIPWVMGYGSRRVIGLWSGIMGQVCNGSWVRYDGSLGYGSRIPWVIGSWLTYTMGHGLWVTYTTGQWLWDTKSDPWSTLFHTPI